MARLRPKIRIASSNLAGTIPGKAPSVMPAVRTAAGVASQIAGEAAEREALHKAAMAAEALKFERDESGNLVAPTVPVNSENMRIPSIFDEEYTKQVLRRYEKQVVIDAQGAFQKFALANKLQPANYEAAANAYIKQVVEAAPPHLKGKLGDELIAYSMSQLNYLYRQREEWDNRRSLDVLDQAMRRDAETMAAVAAENDPVATELAFQKYISSYDEATDDQLVNGARRGELEVNARRLIAQNWLSGEVANVPNTDADRRAMIERLTRFVQGEGMMTTVVNGESVEVPVEELFPVPEVREEIVKASIGQLSAISVATSQAEQARFEVDNKRWSAWYNQHWVKVVHGAEPPNYTKMQEFLDLATRTGNVTLGNMVRVAMTQGLGGEKLTRRERQTDAHVRRQLFAMNEDITKEWNKLEDPTPEDLKVLTLEALDKHAFEIPQNEETADFIIDRVYSLFVGENMPDLQQGDFRTEILPFIDDVMAHVGVIPNTWSEDINVMLQSEDERLFERGLAIAKQMAKHPKVRRNMLHESALSSIGDALEFANKQQITEHSAIKKLIDEATFNPDWAPYGAWHLKSEEEQALYDEAIEGIFEEGAWESYFPGETEVQAINWRLSAAALTTMPADLRMQIMNTLRYEAGKFSSQNKEAIGDWVIRTAERVMSNTGWRQTKIGYDPLRHGPGFADDEQPTYGWSLLPPEAYFPEEAMPEIYRKTLEIARDYAKREGYKAPLSTKNVALEYNAGSDYRQPGWRIMIVREDGQFEYVKDGSKNDTFRNYTVEHFESVMPLMEERRLKDLKLRDMKKRKIREFQRNTPMLPMSQGYPYTRYNPETGGYE